jgi:hypothetical protein
MIVLRVFVFLLFCLQILFLSTGCFTAQSSPARVDEKTGPPPLRHLVLCWLKEPDNVVHQEKIIEITKTFREIPGVLDAQAGKSVASERSIVDDSFDVGILVVVESKNALDEYLTHPVHDHAKKNILLPLVERLVVYDFQE